MALAILSEAVGQIISAREENYIACQNRLVKSVSLIGSSSV